MQNAWSGPSMLKLLKEGFVMSPFPPPTGCERVVIEENTVHLVSP